MNIIKASFFGIILSALLSNSYAVKDGQKFKAWQGECGEVNKQKFCGITQKAFSSGKKPLPIASISIRKEGKGYLAFIRVPLVTDLTKGISLSIDKKEIGKAPYLFCEPGGCVSVVPLTKEIIAKMKKGNKLHMVMIRLGNNKIDAKISLAGFTSAIKSL